MNIVDRYGDVTRTNVDAEHLIRDALTAAEGGELERLRRQVAILSEILGRVIERTAKDDEDIIALVGLSWKWSVTNG